MIQLCIFLPLAGALIAGLFGRAIGSRAAQLVTCAAMIVSAILACVIFKQVALDHQPVVIDLLTWVQSGSFEANWALRVDTLTAVMLIVVTIVSACVHVYSVGYMSHDPHIPRFMAYLSLFTFAMLMLVTADNLLQLFFGWEGVGLCSYLLIGFWYEKPSACSAAIKAFVVNRVGDFGFALGIIGTYLLFDTIVFNDIFAGVAAHAADRIHFLGMDLPAIETLCFLLFIGAMGKSAQLGLHTWLPDAMEGPTPVSALIHAATMVTAGVFMLARLSPMFEHAPHVMGFVTAVGATTAFFAATVGLTQFDIKRVIAYSTCSQLGYMFFAIGVSAYPAAIFHLMTHAFFKALLFLGAGSVIHAMSDEQDMRRMGGIWRKIPVTYALMWIGNLALAGIPFFAGFYSKDMILESAFGAHSDVGNYAFTLGIIAAFMTAFYSWRLLFMTFHGKPRADHHTMEHVHESPPIMVAPLVVLAIGALFSGIVAYESFVGHHWQEFWNGSIVVLEQHKAMENAHHVPLWVKLLPLVASFGGIALAWQLYIRHPEAPAQAARMFGFIHTFFFRKWFFDEAYDRIFVRPAKFLAVLFWKGGDGLIIDGLGPNGIAAVTRGIAQRVSRLQSGYVYHYAFAMLIGVVLLVSWYLARRGA